MLRSYQKLTIGGGIALALFVSTGCMNKQHYRINPGFSVNVALPNINEKNLEKLSALERDTYDRYGPPDYMWMYWNEDGSPTDYFHQMVALKQKRDRQIKRSWIYLDRDAEILFPGPDEVEVRFLSDIKNAFCEHGDPDDINEYSYSTKFTRELVYYKGLRLRYNEKGELVGTQDFPSMTNK